MQNRLGARDCLTNIADAHGIFTLACGQLKAQIEQLVFQGVEFLQDFIVGL